MDFHDSSVGIESACNAGDPGSIPGSGKYSGKGLGYPLNLVFSSTLPWRIPWTMVHGVTKNCTRLSNFHFHLYGYNSQRRLNLEVFQKL